MMKTIISAITAWAKSYFKQSDWKEKDKTSTAYIKNKPTIPTKLSSFANDVGFIKAENIPNVDSKMNKANPTGTGSFSLNRKQDSVIGDYSFAEGLDNTASGIYSHAEGYSNIVEDSTFASHAEGSGNVVKNQFVHVEGYHNIADARYMHVQGKYNMPNNVSKYEENKLYVIGNKICVGEDYYICIKEHTTPNISFWGWTERNEYWKSIIPIIHAVGNGTYDENRSNAHTLDNDGNAWFSGDVYTGSTSGVNKDDGSKKLATEEYVGENINSKMDKNNPVGSGSFSLNRKAGTTIGNYSHAEGYNTTASGGYSHAEGYNAKASNSYSHAEGNYTTASGDCSHVEGGYTRVGNYTPYGAMVATSYGYCGHAEGYGTLAKGRCSHSEGNGTQATGYDSHSEGYLTTASGNYSHSEGYLTTASGDYQHVQGKYNILENSTFLHIVGNGTSSSVRSNAHTLDNLGNAWYAGDVYVGSISGKDRDDGAKKLATEEYVDELLESELNEKLNEMIGSEAFANKILEIIESKGFTLA